MVKKKKSIGKADLSNRELLHIIMQEIADVHHELSGKISGLRTELKGDASSLKTDIENLRGDVQDFREESHQNQVAFITNIQDHERRITVLER